QRQLAGGEDRAAGQRGLMAAGAALVVDAPLTTETGSRTTAATRTAKAVRPAHPVQHAIALGLGAVATNELGHRQAGLELHPIHRHDVAPAGVMAPRLHRRALRSCDRRLRFVANQDLDRVGSCSFDRERDLYAERELAAFLDVPIDQLVFVCQQIASRPNMDGFSGIDVAQGNKRLFLWTVYRL